MKVICSSIATLVALLCITLSTATVVAGGLEKSSSNWEWLTNLTEAFTSSTKEVGAAKPGCANCAKTTASIPVPPRPQVQLNPKLDLEKSMAWLVGHLPCEGWALMNHHKADLLKAEKSFGVPAPVIACVIATESEWDPHADQLNRQTGVLSGTFVGLIQSNKPTLDHMADLLSPGGNSTSESLSKMWHSYAPEIDPSFFKCGPEGPRHPVTKILLTPPCVSMYLKREIIQDCPTGRCMKKLTPSQRKDELTRASIGFVGAYLRNINDRVITLTERSHSAEELAQMKRSKRTQWLASAVGYNAGPDVSYSYLPKEAFERRYDNGSWIPLIKSPPAKFKQSLAKIGEVTQYIDWINSCLDANPKVGPADRRAHLADPVCFGDGSRPNIEKLLRVREKGEVFCEPRPEVLCSVANPKNIQKPSCRAPGTAPNKTKDEVCKYKF